MITMKPCKAFYLVVLYFAGYSPSSTALTTAATSTTSATAPHNSITSAPYQSSFRTRGASVPTIAVSESNTATNAATTLSSSGTATGTFSTAGPSDTTAVTTSLTEKQTSVMTSQAQPVTTSFNTSPLTGTPSGTTSATTSNTSPSPQTTSQITSATTSHTTSVMQTTASPVSATAAASFMTTLIGSVVTSPNASSNASAATTSSPTEGEDDSNQDEQKLIVAVSAVSAVAVFLVFLVVLLTCCILRQRRGKGAEGTLNSSSNSRSDPYTYGNDYVPHTTFNNSLLNSLNRRPQQKPQKHARLELQTPEASESGVQASRINPDPLWTSPNNDPYLKPHPAVLHNPRDPYPRKQASPSPKRERRRTKGDDLQHPNPKSILKPATRDLELDLDDGDLAIFTARTAPSYQRDRHDRSPDRQVQSARDEAHPVDRAKQVYTSIYGPHGQEVNRNKTANYDRPKLYIPRPKVLQ